MYLCERRIEEQGLKEYFSETWEKLSGYEEENRPANGLMGEKNCLRDTEMAKHLKKEYGIPDTEDILLMMDDILYEQLAAASYIMMAHLDAMRDDKTEDPRIFRDECHQEEGNHMYWIMMKFENGWF